MRCINVPDCISRKATRELLPIFSYYYGRCRLSVFKSFLE